MFESNDVDDSITWAAVQNFHGMIMSVLVFFFILHAANSADPAVSRI